MEPTSLSPRARRAPAKRNGHLEAAVVRGGRVYFFSAFIFSGLAGAEVFVVANAYQRFARAIPLVHVSLVFARP